MLKKLFITGIILLFASSCFAATAGNTSDPKTPYGPGIANMQASGLGPFKVSFDCDWIFDKDLTGASGVTSAEIEGQKYLVRIGYTFADRIEPYLKLGGSHLKASWKQRGYDIKAKSEHGLAIGLGAKALVFEIPEHRLRFSLDGQYLYTDPDIREGFVDNPERSISVTEFKVKEWQIAGMVSMEFPLNYDKKDPAAIYSLIPYAGLAYSNSDNDVRFRCAGVDFDLGNAENEDKFVLITGCDLISPENVSLNAEGRWIGETAASGGVTVKF